MTIETLENRSRGQDLEALRRQMRALEQGAVERSRRAVPLGARALDERLPGGGLSAAGLHEILPARSEWDDGATLGFALALLGRLATRREGGILWATRQADLYAPALAGFGIAAERLLLVRTGGDTESLWALEEGLRCPELAAVVGEVGELNPTAARRLQLAAETIQRPCLLLQRHRKAPRRRTAASPALTRWRVAAGASDRSLSKSLVGNPAWRVELLRCRGGQPAAFEVEWDHATGDFAMAAELCNSAPAAFERTA